MSMSREAIRSAKMLPKSTQFDASSPTGQGGGGGGDMSLNVTLKMARTWLEQTNGC
jgi:hypothetical protein